MSDEPKGSFVRWQSITIAHLTYAINLILTLSVATLGFLVTLLLGDKCTPPRWGKCALVLSIFLLVASVGLGLWAVINRLRDFRLTTSVARRREKMTEEKNPKEEIHQELAPDRLLAKKLGTRTWLIFWWQVGTFGVGILFAIVAVLTVIGHNLV